MTFLLRREPRAMESSQNEALSGSQPYPALSDAQDVQPT